MLKKQYTECWALIDKLPTKTAKTGQTRVFSLIFQFAFLTYTLARQWSNKNPYHFPTTQELDIL